MTSKRVHCSVVEVPVEIDGAPVLDIPPRDLLPWADPYIAKLLTRHRLQAALEDSLRFVKDEAAETGLGWARFNGALPPEAAKRRQP